MKILSKSNISNTKKAFWCINETLKHSPFKNVYPIHTYIPSFGDWGFIMTSNRELHLESPDIKLDLKYLSKKFFSSLFEFPLDQVYLDSEVSTLDKPIVSKYYEEGWMYWK